MEWKLCGVQVMAEPFLMTQSMHSLITAKVIWGRTPS